MARSLGSRATSLGIGWNEAARFAETEALFESPPPPYRFTGAGPFFGYFDPLRERMEVDHVSIDAPGFRYLIRQYAPVALTHGSWVAPVAGTATGHRRPFALLFRYHAGGGARRVRDGYRRLLALQGIGLPEVVDEAFIRDGSLLDAAFLPAVLWLCIARSPQGLFPELIGMLLCQALGLLPFRALMAGRCPPAIRGDTSLGPLLGPAAPHGAGLDPISTLVEDHLETARVVLGRQGVVHAWHRIRNGLLAQFLAERGLVVDPPSRHGKRAGIRTVMRRSWRSCKPSGPMPSASTAIRPWVTDGSRTGWRRGRTSGGSWMPLPRPTSWIRRRLCRAVFSHRFRPVAPCTGSFATTRSLPWWSG